MVSKMVSLPSLKVMTRVDFCGSPVPEYEMVPVTPSTLQFLMPSMTAAL